MKWSLFVILFAMQFYHLQTTESVGERVRALKERLRSSMRHKVERDALPAYYDSDENTPIKPILEEEKHDELKFKLKKLKSLPLLRTVRTNTNKLSKMKALRATPHDLPPLRQNTVKSSFAMDVFYRKAFDLNSELEWVHCSELITPFVRDVRDPGKWPTKVGLKDPTVVRLLQLISANTTKLGKSEKRSIMYQISRLNIRMYNWDLNTMYTVLTKLLAPTMLKTRGKKADFKALKAGVKSLFVAWNTDLSNTTVLLTQARIFRPPCFPDDNKGSSKFVRGSTIPTKSTKARSLELECLRRGMEYC